MEKTKNLSDLMGNFVCARCHIWMKFQTSDEFLEDADFSPDLKFCPYCGKQVENEYTRVSRNDDVYREIANRL